MSFFVPARLMGPRCIRSIKVLLRCAASPRQSQLVCPLPAAYRCLHSSAPSAAQSADTRKKHITLRSGDPSTKKWGELSGGEKVVRTTSTGTSAAAIIIGVLLTGAVFTVLYLEVIAPDSVTNWFNRAHDRVKKDPRCVQLLGGGRIKAYGEETGNRWARNRPIASNSTVDKFGTQHLRIHFNVEGDLDKGVVKLHIVKRRGQSEFEYRYLFVDIGGTRVYLENADDAKAGGDGGTSKRGFLGVRWGW